MARFPSPFEQARSYQAQDMQAAGAVISRFFNAVYAWMAAGLAITALVAYYVASRPDIFFSAARPGVFLVLLIVELLLVGTIAGAVRRIGPTAATLLFLLYAAINGVMLSAIFLAYAHAVIA